MNSGKVTLFDLIHMSAAFNTVNQCDSICRDDAFPADSNTFGFSNQVLKSITSYQTGHKQAATFHISTPTHEIHAAPFFGHFCSCLMWLASQQLSTCTMAGCTMTCSFTTAVQLLAAWHSGRTPVFDRQTFPVHARPVADR